MTQQFDSSLIPSDDEHDRHYCGMQARCLHCLCHFAVDEDHHGSLCPDCQETHDEAFPPDNALADSRENLSTANL